MLTHKELLEQFIFFENDNNLIEWDIDNIPIWELIRMNVFTDLKDKLVNKNFNIQKRKINNGFGIFFKFIKNSIFQNPFNISKQIDLLIFNHPRRKINSGFYEDIYIDTLLPILNNDKYIIIEGYVNNNIAHYKPVKSNNLYYLDAIQYPSKIMSYLPLGYKLTIEEKNKISKIEKSINLNWNTQISNLEQHIVTYIRRWNFVYPKFIKLLENTVPKKIINVVSYSFFNQVMTCAAKKKQIPVIEIQHGTIGKYHIAYNFKNHKNLHLKTFPTHLFAWGQVWIKEARIPLSIKNINIVGFPYLRNFQSNQDTKRNLKQILVISQYREDIALFTKKIAENLPEYVIIYKAHPSEYQIIESKYHYFKKIPNLKIVADDNLSLYDLFMQSTFVLGVHSTALIEALAFCPNVYIIKLPGWEYFEDLEVSNNLKFISNSEEALKNIEESVPKESTNDVDYYFRKMSINQIYDLINKTDNK